MTERPGLDGATVEVVRSYLLAAADEMRTTLIRTAFNPVIYEVLDFGISIYDHDARLVAEAPGLTRFLGANDYSLQKGIEYVGRERLEPGDVIMLNYPYWNAAHAYDATLFAPVFHGAGQGGADAPGEPELIGYVCVRAHWMDLGAKDPGYVLDSTDVHQEGLLFPGTKIWRAGELQHEIVELIRFNSRMPDLVIGDLHAQVSCLKTGERRLLDIVGKFGVGTVRAAIERMYDTGEQASRDALAELPHGSWTAVDWMDDDGLDDEPIRLQVTVTIDDDGFHVDFAGSSDMVRGPVNLPFGATIACARVAFKALTTPDERGNAGHMRPLTVSAPEGSLFHAVYPAATFTQWTGNLAVELIYKALAQGMPDRLAASSGGDVPGFMMVGAHPDTGDFFAISNNDVIGWGATAAHDGAGPINHLCQTIARTTPLEVLEAKSGMRFERWEVRTDSGGAGRHRGGAGIRRDIRFVSDGEFLSVVKKTRSAPWALAGGHESRPTTVTAFPGTDRERRLSTRRVAVAAGDLVVIETGGGAGHGDPAERHPDAVRHDVAEGYVSAEAARRIYGVTDV
ncbi:hydantoinase B/oxoprolinase family protein [Agromyces aerolatus]|uniref:hydantoinase B/oxoprolinase family protein n=1 Tax=Agromyces sp. LY-1074 TaxID=3074080 RepID=UPI00285D36B6|nr:MULTISPECIES: hydantoinase B/oxoprolinase family protein [unclassified Agromyces]MDR5698336.1 hydantoinase B/oxoprolinase family protein [Agromyces sp. LY-1074]MDR5704630.1 hydantoinase B/oxoprolinase family protein [Agromyces sp. LY-1358]